MTRFEELKNEISDLVENTVEDYGNKYLICKKKGLVSTIREQNSMVDLMPLLGSTAYECKLISEDVRLSEGIRMAFLDMKIILERYLQDPTVHYPSLCQPEQQKAIHQEIIEYLTKINK